MSLVGNNSKLDKIKRLFSSVIFSRGHADAEIEAVFAKYDLDGDRILDEDEQRRMQEDLEGQKVNIHKMKRSIYRENIERIARQIWVK